MSTLAWDGKSLSADRQSDAGGYKYEVTKIWVLTDGRLFGWTGDFGDGLAIRQWLEGGEKPDIQAKEGGSGLVIAEGKAYRIEAHLQQWEMPGFTATGSGRDYAIMAMHLGHNSAEAVKLASLYDTYSGMGVDTIYYWAGAIK